MLDAHVQEQLVGDGSHDGVDDFVEMAEVDLMEVWMMIERKVWMWRKNVREETLR